MLSKLIQINHKIFGIDWTYQQWKMFYDPTIYNDLDPLNRYFALKKKGYSLELDYDNKEENDFSYVRALNGNLYADEDQSDSESELPSDEWTENHCIFDEWEQNEYDLSLRGKKKEQKQQWIKLQDTKCTENHSTQMCYLCITGDGHFPLIGELVPRGEANKYTKPILRNLIIQCMQNSIIKKTKFQIRIDGIKYHLLRDVFREIAEIFYNKERTECLMRHYPSKTDCFYDIQKWINDKCATVCELVYTCIT